ncbi:major facilitator superfamily transporter [Stachybotrys elegans]|uniref:Major facilitator superfamily transporter n=1 Tax=Stachybotrys elegans TaxID=80388 RepID=A0A8K0SXG0_9HYPO|nr:major facilitator superfamily transporter [Stachybotrys elegans]
MAAGVLDHEKAHGQRSSAEIECPPSIHLDITAVSNPSLNHNTDTTQDQDGIRASTHAQLQASSAHFGPLYIVPRSKRRGLFGRFTIIPEVDCPYKYRNSTKWGITATISLATAVGPMGSSIFYPALNALADELGASETIINMSVALYMLSLSIFPIWWSAFSEQFGRRSIYLISFTLFIVFSVLCAVSTNAPMLIVFRFLAGGASASVQVIGTGTIADIWESHDRGRAMSLFYLGPMIGPLVGPLLGGVLAQHLRWRSTMWFLAIYGFIIVVAIFFLLPETLARKNKPAMTQELTRMSTRESLKVKSSKFATSLNHYLVEPLSVLLLLRFPPVFLTVLIASIAFSSVYFLNIAIQYGFARPPYNFNETAVGVTYMSTGLGYVVSSAVGGPWIDNIMAREARKADRYNPEGKLIYLPEDRMKENAWLANTLYPLSLLWFGWSMHYEVQYMVPISALFVFGFSSMLHFTLGTTMLTEFVRKRSSAGVAVNNFVRNILSCVGTIVAAPWIESVGMGYMMTTLCVICLVLGSMGIWLISRNAHKWRVAMDEALRKMD